MKNEYISYPAIIEEIRRETLDTKTFRLRFKDKKIGEAFTYKQGQFMEVSVLGAGEAPISITSSPSRLGFLELTIRAAGRVTKAIHSLSTGDCVYLRGPYGNAFPFEEIKGKNNEGCGKTILLNPGAVCGIQNGKPGIASYAFYTTFDNSADIKIGFGAEEY